jgi:fused signal recognition particle receptor
MEPTTVILILLVVAVVFGVGVLIASRRRSVGPPPAPVLRPVERVGAERQLPSKRDRPAPSATGVTDPVDAPLDLAPDDAEREDAAPDDAELVVDAMPDAAVGVESGSAPEADERSAETVDLGSMVRPSFRARMGKARGALTSAFLGIRQRAGITEGTWDDLEEALLRADVGVRVTDELLGGLKQRVKAKEFSDPETLLAALRNEMTRRLDGTARGLRLASVEPGHPDVWLFVGVNGVGKTTTIGKVGALQRAEGRSVLMAAGDTFRAAAAEQLQTWAERSGSEFVRGAEGSDPSSVIFDGVERAAARGVDLVLADTAGRLHTKSNLMDELRKVRRVASKGAGRVTEVLLVIDATTGQNGLTQAREFGEALQADPSTGSTGLTGVVLTKLDGSAKGGIVFAIETELGVPVKLVGLGETIGDLVPFDPTQFIDALFES